MFHVRRRRSEGKEAKMKGEIGGYVREMCGKAREIGGLVRHMSSYSKVREIVYVREKGRQN